jgi:basic amino acid/polyamine antiporter, APA family
VCLCLIFVVINMFGSKHAGRLQVGLVFSLIFVMIIYIIYGLPNISLNHFHPFAPKGINRTIATAGFVFISYGGLLKISSVAEEIRNPSKNIPLGMMFSLISVIILYILMVFVTIGTLDAEVFKASLTPIMMEPQYQWGDGGL